MVQLRALTGKNAGTTYPVPQFPSVIGRSNAADVLIEGDGVWDQHAALDLDPSDRFHIARISEAILLVNGELASEALLRNGDLIDVGSVKLQFWLSEPHQKAFRFREVATWAGLGIFLVLQLALIYWLTR